LIDNKVLNETLDNVRPGTRLNNGRLIRPAKHLADRELWGIPTSASDQRRMERAREEAQKLFNHSRRIEDRELEQLFPGISECRGVIQAAVPPLNGIGNVQPYELIVISTICKYLNPDLVFEFGTFNGLTTLHLAMNSPAGAKIMTIDLDPEDARRQLVNDDTYYIKDNCVGQMFQDTPEQAKIEQIFGDTTTFDQAAYKGKADLIFIDAGHEYELVRSDTEKALDMLTPNGVILWHDYVFSHYGVYTWLNELSHSIPLYSIPKATLVCYRRSDSSADTCSIMENLEAQTAKPRIEQSARVQKTGTSRISMQIHRLRKRLVPGTSRRARILRYLLK
jgi:predicted O-methyltransferase YrrM